MAKVRYANIGRELECALAETDFLSAPRQRLHNVCPGHDPRLRKPPRGVVCVSYDHEGMDRPEHSHAARTGK